MLSGFPHEQTLIALIGTSEICQEATSYASPEEQTPLPKCKECSKLAKMNAPSWRIGYQLPRYGHHAETVGDGG